MVWLAEGIETAVQRQVALKIPFIASDARTLAERFNRERDFLALLTHSNIARLYDAGAQTRASLISSSNTSAAGPSRIIAICSSLDSGNASVSSSRFFEPSSTPTQI